MKKTPRLKLDLAFVPTTMVLTKKITRAKYNPRVMTSARMASLKASLQRNGVVRDFVVQKRSDDGEEMVMVGGHQMLTALEELSKEKGLAMPLQLPCKVVDVPDRKAKELNIALNQIEGDFEPYKLGEVLLSMGGSLTVHDAEAMGFTLTEVDQAMLLAKPLDEHASMMVNQTPQAGEAEIGAFSRSVTLSFECETVEQRDKLRDLIKKLAADRKQTAGKIIMEALHAYGLGKKKVARSS